MTEATDNRLLLLIERIERLNAEKKGIADDVRDVYNEAKSVGCWAVKFQLFPNNEMYTRTGNVWLDPITYLHLQDYARSKNILKASSTS